MDMALKQSTGFDFDIGIDGPDVLHDNGLRTAIIISLFTHRLAEPDDEIPDGSTNRRGYWNGAIGSRLWLLNRSKQTLNTLLRAKEYEEEAVQWLIDDVVNSRMVIETEWVSRGVLGIRVQLFKAENEPFDEIFEYSLEAL